MFTIGTTDLFVLICLDPAEADQTLYSGDGGTRCQETQETRTAPATEHERPQRSTGASPDLI